MRTKGYGKKILRLLPAGMPTTNHLSDVERFFSGTRDHNVGANLPL